MIKIPYGISNFETLITQGYHYVDRTQYIEKIENIGDKNIAFLRPRRFGKSLFINMLKDYYDIRKKAKFDTLFGKYYIGKNPTSRANSYMILDLEFSGILTDTIEKAHDGFVFKVKSAASLFVYAYFPEEGPAMKAQFQAESEANSVIKKLFDYITEKNCKEKVYVLIDEYDHFANELIAWDLDAFKSVVSQNGWVRKFYEAIKTATRDGIVDSVFITGVSPITLDSLTSGFNIVKQLSGNHILHNMMGFTKEEVEGIMLGVGAKQENLPKIMTDLKSWYNGYLFSEEVSTRLYNPDMVLYFSSEYRSLQKYPRKMLDVNVMSDYSKIRRQFQIGGQEQDRISILNELIQNEQIVMKMTDQFSFEKRFDNRDFINLLYYTGAITIKGIQGDETIFNIPNYVIKQLYFEYFSQILMEKVDLNHDILGYAQAIRNLVYDNNIDSLVQIVSTIMSRLSNRDSMSFGEKHLKSIFMAILMFSEVYYIHSELELNKSYVDLFIERTSRFQIPFQYLIEFKYFSQKKYEELQVIKEGNIQTEWQIEIEKAKNQLLNYIQLPYFQEKEDLVPRLIVFVGHEPVIVEIMNDE